MSDEYRNALAVGTVLDTYRIERVLGEGGFGVTYLVTELNLGKEYAIKELIPDGVAIRQGGTTVMARSSSMEGDFEATRRHFIKEARVLATLKHPAIVAVHRLFEANGTCYMVMDYVEGETLGAYLKKQGGKLGSREEFEGIFYPIMDGLEVLHGKEMIHRDIKPGNIMVTPDGSSVLLDFGASGRVENHTVTMTQMVSAGYSPYEQYMARAKQGPYTDIYALGATMVRAITGAKPDDATDRMMGDTYSSVTARAELVSVYGLELLSALDASVMVKIEERPQSIRDWRKLMEAVVTPADVEFPESPKPEREERVSQPASPPPLPTVALTPTVELPGAALSTGPQLGKKIKKTFTCIHCGTPANRDSVSKSFLLFPRFKCRQCNSENTYPASRGAQVLHWVLGVLIPVILIPQINWDLISIRKILNPVVFLLLSGLWGIVANIAIRRDHQERGGKN